MKNGYIILAGGGDIKESFLIDEKYFSLLPNNAKILYIPIALNRTRFGFESCHDWFSSLISEHNKEKDVDFTMLLGGDEVPDFKLYDSIYIGGGNTYKLLDYIYKNNLVEKITEYIKGGGIVYGGSAGAIILGKDIRTSEEENDKNYPNSSGLNLLEDKSVICHYVDSLDPKIFEIVKKIKSEVIAIPENAGVIFNETLEIVGQVFLFSKDGKKQTLQHS